jgi:hypothetical protein
VISYEISTLYGEICRGPTSVLIHTKAARTCWRPSATTGLRLSGAADDPVMSAFVSANSSDKAGEFVVSSRFVSGLMSGLMSRFERAAIARPSSGIASGCGGGTADAFSGSGVPWLDSGRRLGRISGVRQHRRSIWLGQAVRPGWRVLGVVVAAQLVDVVGHEAGRRRRTRYGPRLGDGLGSEPPTVPNWSHATRKKPGLT